jgi:hypothetical protein
VAAAVDATDLAANQFRAAPQVATSQVARSAWTNALREDECMCCMHLMCLHHSDFRVHLGKLGEIGGVCAGVSAGPVRERATGKYN